MVSKDKLLISYQYKILLYMVNFMRNTAITGYCIEEINPQFVSHSVIPDFSRE